MHLSIRDYILKDCFHEIMLIISMHVQLRVYKRQIEEAEEIAAMNLAKFRKTQVDLEEGEERADLSEHALAKLRATAGRSRGTTPLPGIPNALQKL